MAETKTKATLSYSTQCILSPKFSLNGTDFDPANLHDWPKVAEEFAQWAASLQQASVYATPKG